MEMINKNGEHVGLTVIVLDDKGSDNNDESERLGIIKHYTLRNTIAELIYKDKQTKYARNGNLAGVPVIVLDKSFNDEYRYIRGDCCLWVDLNDLKGMLNGVCPDGSKCENKCNENQIKTCIGRAISLFNISLSRTSEYIKNESHAVINEIKALLIN